MRIRPFPPALLLAWTTASRAVAQSPPPGPAFDLAALRPRHDSLAIRFRGAPIGFTRSRLEETGDRLRYTEETLVPPLVEQSTIIDLDRHGAVLRVRQRGQVQGETTSIEVDYAGGRVTGKARTVAPDGPREVAIDTLVPAGTVDDNALQLLLPALAWAPEATWRIGVFSSGLNEYRIGTLTVAGTEPVTLEAGPVECYRAEWTGMVQAVTFWVAREAPHRLIKVVVAGTPLEILAPR